MGVYAFNNCHGQRVSFQKKHGISLTLFLEMYVYISVLSFGIKSLDACLVFMYNLQSANQCEKPPNFWSPWFFFVLTHIKYLVHL